MGIGSNYIVEKAEEEQREALREQVVSEAAVRIVNRQPRSEAISDANALVAARQEAISKHEYSEDADGNIISFFDSALEESAVPRGKERQVEAIANELREQSDTDL